MKSNCNRDTVSRASVRVMTFKLSADHENGCGNHIGQDVTKRLVYIDIFT